jgi:hypothetical protein
VPHGTRLYSIAASRYGDFFDGKTTSLCVRRATYWDEELKADDPAKKGICSNFLCDATPGTEIMMTGERPRRFDASWVPHSLQLEVRPCHCEYYKCTSPHQLHAFHSQVATGALGAGWERLESGKARGKEAGRGNQQDTTPSVQQLCGVLNTAEPAHPRPVQCTVQHMQVERDDATAAPTVVPWYSPQHAPHKRMSISQMAHFIDPKPTSTPARSFASAHACPSPPTITSLLACTAPNYSPLPPACTSLACLP